MRGMYLKSEIAQRELSDLGCSKHTCMPTPKRKIPSIHIRFSTNREPVGHGEIKYLVQTFCSAERVGFLSIGNK
jgi:hypothetical protein